MLYPQMSQMNADENQSVGVSGVLQAWFVARKSRLHAHTNLFQEGQIQVVPIGHCRIDQ
jgi:hypothetical protein